GRVALRAGWRAYARPHEVVTSKRPGLRFDVRRRLCAHALQPEQDGDDQRAGSNRRLEFRFRRHGRHLRQSALRRIEKERVERPCDVDASAVERQLYGHAAAVEHGGRSNAVIPAVNTSSCWKYRWYERANVPAHVRARPAQAAIPERGRRRMRGAAYGVEARNGR